MQDFLDVLQNTSSYQCTIVLGTILFISFVVLILDQVLPENQDQNYIYGMLAFPLLELGRMDDAEKAARKGLAINKNDCWSQHNVCGWFWHNFVILRSLSA